MDELEQAREELLEAFDNFKQQLREFNPSLYRHWKAYGYEITDEFVGDHPNVESMNFDDGLEEEEEED